MGLRNLANRQGKSAKPAAAGADHRGATRGAITAHPLFPAIVALWFAALFGLGSLAIRPALLESVVLAVGLHALVPAAAPPLGLTARLMIAIAMAALGAIIGLLLARRLAAPAAQAEPRKKGRQVQAPQAEAEAAAQAGPRGLFGRTDPDCDNDDRDAAPAAPAFPGRRRALALEGDALPDIHDFVPLPGGGAPQILDISAFAIDDDAALAVPAAASMNDPADSAAVTNTAPAHETEADDDYVFEPVGGDAAPVIRARIEPLPVVEKVDDVAATAAELPQARRAGIFALTEAAPPLFGTGATLDAPAEAPAEAPVFAARARFALPTGTAAERIASANLEDLSHVELIERLALAMQRRRDAVRAAPAPAVPAPAVPAEAPAPTAEPVALPRIGRLTVGGAPEGVQVQAEVPAPLPAAFRPIGLDTASDDDACDEDEGVLAHVPPRNFVLRVKPSREEASDEAGELHHAPAELAEASDDEEDDGYGSLVEMTVASAPPRQPLIRIEEPDAPAGAIEPVVIFPGQQVDRPTSPSAFGDAPVLRQFDPPGTAGTPRANPAPVAAINDPGEAERALRSALATLQRMNGAA